MHSLASRAICRLADLATTRSSSSGSMSASGDEGDVEDRSVLSDEGYGELTKLPQQMAMLMVLLWLSSGLFETRAVLDVHSSLEADLGLTACAKISDPGELFAWLEGTLIPAVSDVSKSGTVADVDLTTAQCSALHTLHHEKRCDECDAIMAKQEGARGRSNVTANRSMELIFVDAYTVLFSGITVRQAAHCSLASLDRATGLLRRQSNNDERGAFDPDNPNLPCVPSELFNAKEAQAQKTKLPPHSCYSAVNMTAFAETMPVDQRPWITSSSIDKNAFFIPCSSTTMSARDAAQSTLGKVQEIQWMDATTAAVQIKFMVLSQQYGLLTDVSSPSSYGTLNGEMILNTEYMLPGVGTH